MNEQEYKKYLKDYSDNILFEPVKGDKGDVGDKGDKGDQGDKGEKGDKGDQGETGEKGKRGYKGTDGLDGKDGIDGSPDSPLEIANKLNTLKEVIDASVIKGAVSKTEFETRDKKVLDGMARIDGRIKLIDQRWGGHGGGSGSGTVKSVTATAPLTSSSGINPDISTSMSTNKLIGRGTAGTGVMEEITIGSNLTLSGTTLSATSGGLSLLTPTGTVNGVNDTFTFTSAPSIIVVDGVPRQKTQSDGTVNWTGTTVAVLSVAPNFDIFGM